MGGWGGTIWDHFFDTILRQFKIMLEPFYDHVRTILGPPMRPKYVFRREIKILEMARTNFDSSIRKTPYQPLM